MGHFSVPATDALVLRVRNGGEYDRLVTLLTPEFGRVQAIAKGVRRASSKRAAFLQPGSHIRCSWVVSHERRVLTEVTLVQAMTTQTSLERLRDLSAVLESLYLLSLEEVEQSAFFTAGHQLVSYILQNETYNRRIIRDALFSLAAQQGVEVDESQAISQSVSQLLESSFGRPIRSFAYLQVQ